MPHIIVRFLFVWYQSQTFAVKWQNVVSTSFNVSNGVRQGSILSPWLFNVFINHIQYADDSILLSPSPTGLQRLIDICQSFATLNDMLYNFKKTCCMVISAKSNFSKRIPDIFLNDKILSFTDEHKYLGVKICNNFSDNADIKRQRKVEYAKGNSLICKFKYCTEDIKDRLFQSYCGNFYCCSLWNSYSSATFNSLKVAYNNVYRYLHNVRPQSMSAQFVSKSIDSFNVLICKACSSLYYRCFNCDNLLVSTLINSAYFMFKSKLLRSWTVNLFKPALLSF